jgi:pimeloyl-ACP methyl ester carboxylesterase
MTAAGARFTDCVSARGIGYRTLGSGHPIVLLHGWCLDRRVWMYQEEALARRAHVVSPDLPGFGISSTLAGPYTIERYVDELARFLEELALSDVTVCGFAFGALVAMSTVAAGRGGRIGRIVAIGVPSAGTAPYLKMPKSMRHDWPDFALRSARAILKYPPSGTTVEWLGRMFGSTPLPVAIATLDILSTFEPVDIAALVMKPTLFIHGLDDDVVPPDVSSACAALMPDARVELVERAGHLAIVDNAHRVTELIGDFALGRADTASPLNEIKGGSG